MRLNKVLATLTMLTAVLAGGAGTAVATTSTSTTSRTSAGAAAAPYCGITWGSGAKSAGTMSQASLIEARTGRHDCYDRLVFEFNGAADGYRVQYGDSTTGGEGLSLRPYTAGGALINVSLQAPAHDPDYTSTFPHRVGDHVVNVLRYRTLRDVVFGGTYEGETTFAVGVRARLPFRVFTLSGPGGHSRIVLDVAHQWQE